MKVNSPQFLAVVAGIMLIVIYSGLMMATDGNSGWAWILLAAGIALLIGGGILLRRNASSGDDGSA
jgi:zinc transporter ZupT